MTDLPSGLVVIHGRLPLHGGLRCERVMNHPVARDWLLVRWFTCVMLASTSSSRSAAEQFKSLFSFKKFCKIFQISCYIESSDACMEY